MKKFKRILSVILVLCALMSLLPSSAFAAEVVVSGTCGDDLTWKLASDGTLTISGSGAMSFGYDGADAPWYAKRSSIKRVVIGDGVTSIARDAFYRCSLTAVTIPDSLTSIAYDAFYKCSLTSVYITDLAAWCGIEFSMNPLSFAENLYLNGELVTDLIIPDGVTSIGDFAFWGCDSLTSVTIGNGVTTIGDSAFEYCTSLTSVEIPDSVTSIGGWAFNKCTGLTAVYITDLAAWCGIDFDDYYYSNPLRYAHNLYLNGELVTDLIIPDGVTTIVDYAFMDCDSLTSVTIPDNVTSIGESAFYECTGLTAVTIGNGVTTIGESAFYECTGLTSATIGDSVTFIGSGAFYKCTGLTAVYITDLAAWCEINAQHSPMDYADNLYLNNVLVTGSLIIPDGVTSISHYAFDGCKGMTSVTIPDSVTSIGYYAFRNCSALTSVTIPDSVASIGNLAFYNCTGLTAVTIPDSVTTIGQQVFNLCTGLTSVTIGNGVTTIGDYAFRGCDSLTSVTIGNGVTTIGDSAFEDCTSLTSVTIPDSVSNISYRAFYSCTSLSSVYFEGNEPSSVGQGAFNKNIVTLYYIPGTSGWTDSPAYDAAAGTWNGYKLATWDGNGNSGGNDQAKTVTFTFVPALGGGTCFDSEFTYDESLFKTDSSQFSFELARLSLGTAYSSYSYSCSGHSEHSESDRPLDYSIENTLVNQLGFDRFESHGYKWQENGYRGDRDSVAASFAVKKMDNGETVVAVAPRSGGYDGEWEGNFEIGQTVKCDGYIFHKNFFEAGMQVLYWLNNYIESIGDTYDVENAKIWIFGYSRGAAVANIVAHFVKMSEFNADISCYSFANLGFKQENIYAYTFATPAHAKPDGGTAMNRTDSYIHNVIGYSDFVPMVVMKDWGFNRFGEVRVLPNKSTNAEIYNQHIGKAKEVFADIMRRTDRAEQADYQANDNRHDVVDAVLGLLAQIIETPDNYTKKYQETIIDVVGSCGLYHKDDEKRDAAIVELVKTIFKNKGAEIIFGAVLSIKKNLSAVEKAATNDLIARAASLDTNTLDSGNYNFNDLENALYELVYDFVKANCANVYRVRSQTTGLLSHIYVELDKEDYARHIVAALKDMLNITSLDGISTDIAKEHFPELYLAWFASLDTLDHAAYKLIRVACPTDVYVYDAKGNLLVSIVDNVIEGDVLHATVNTLGEKSIYVPADDGITVDIVAREVGTMNVSVEEYDQLQCVSKTFYNDIPLQQAAEFELSVEEELGGEIVLLNEEMEMEADGQVSGDAIHATVTATVSGEGAVTGAGTYAKGDVVRLAAVAEDGFVLEGWYAGETLVSRETEYSFSLSEDVEVVAKFVAEQPKTVEDIDELAIQVNTDTTCTAMAAVYDANGQFIACRMQTIGTEKEQWTPDLDGLDLSECEVKIMLLTNNGEETTWTPLCNMVQYRISP